MTGGFDSGMERELDELGQACRARVPAWKTVGPTLPRQLVPPRQVRDSGQHLDPRNGDCPRGANRSKTNGNGKSWSIWRLAAAGAAACLLFCVAGGAYVAWLAKSSFDGLEARARTHASRRQATRIGQEPWLEEQQLRVATVHQLAAQSHSLREESPVESTLLAIEAIGLARRSPAAAMPIAHEALLNATAVLGAESFTGHKSEIQAMAISSDGRWLVTGSGDSTARVWDLSADEPNESSLVLRGHQDAVHSIAVSPNSRWVVTGSADGTSRVWDLCASDPASDCVAMGGTQPILSVDISPDSRLLATQSLDQTRIWDLTASNPASSSIQLECGGGRKVLFSPDGRWLASSGGKDKTIRLWDLTEHEPDSSRIELRGHQEMVTAMTVSPDSRWLATASTDRTARLWDLAAEQPAASPVVLAGHEDSVAALAISADARWLATGSGDATSRLWDLSAEDPSEAPLALRGHQSEVQSVAVAPNNHWLVTGSYDGTARVWDLTAKDLTARPLVLRGHASNVSSIAFSHDSRRLFTASADSTVRLWILDVDSLVRRARRGVNTHVGDAVE